MKTILETFNVFDKNHSYWINQDMTSIPPEFLDEIGKLGNYIEVNPDRNHVFEYPKEVVKHLSESSTSPTDLNSQQDFISLFHFYRNWVLNFDFLFHNVSSRSELAG